MYNMCIYISLSLSPSPTCSNDTAGAHVKDTYKHRGLYVCHVFG